MLDRGRTRYRDVRQGTSEGDERGVEMLDKGRARC